MHASKPNSIVKPTQDTKFHIDYEWWAHSGNDLRSYILTHLPNDLRERVEQTTQEVSVDYVDPITAEVFRLDVLGLAVQEASKRADYISPQVSLVDSVFRVFLANGNLPCSPRELEERTGRDARTILKTLGGLQIYRGIRPIST